MLVPMPAMPRVHASRPQPISPHFSHRDVPHRGVAVTIKMFAWPMAPAQGQVTQIAVPGDIRPHAAWDKVSPRWPWGDSLLSVLA